MYYFTADPHFGHANAIWMCKRPFPDVETMNEALIAAWNGRVKGTDTIFIVGDMFYRWKGSGEHFEKIEGQKAPDRREPRRLLDGKG